MSRKLSQPEDRIGVKLTSTERSALLEGLTFLPSKYEQLIRDTPLRMSVMLSPDDLDKLGRYIATEAKETQDRKKGRKLDAIFSRIKKLLASRIEAEPTGKISVDDVIKSEMLTHNVAGNVTGVAEFVAAALRVAESRGIKTKPLEFFYLAPAQREVLLAVPSMAKSIRTELKKGHASFNVAEVASMTISLAEFSVDATGRQQFAALLVVDHLMRRLKIGIPGIRDAEPGNSELANAESITGTRRRLALSRSQLRLSPGSWDQ